MFGIHYPNQPKPQVVKLDLGVSMKEAENSVHALRICTGQSAFAYEVLWLPYAR